MPACQASSAAGMAGSSLNQEVSNTPPTFSTTMTVLNAAFTAATMASSASVSTKSPLGNSWPESTNSGLSHTPTCFSMVSKADLRSQPSPENRLMEITAASAKAAARRTMPSGSSGSRTSPGSFPAAYSAAT